MKPNLPLAIALGLLAPGAGLWYAGWPKAAAAVIAVFLASIVGLPWLAAEGYVDAARLPSLLAASALLLWGPAAAFGALAALRAPARDAAVQGPRSRWFSPWWVVGVIVATWAASSALRTRVVVPYLASFAVVEDNRFEPGLKRGALVVVKRRYAPAEVTAGALVLVTRNGKDELARVKSTESGVELADGARVSPVDVIGVVVLPK